MNEEAGKQPATGTAEPATGFLTGQRKLYIAVALLVMALGYFGYIAFQGTAVFYLTVDELLSESTEAGETVRVSGKLVHSSFRREPEGTIARFNLTDGGKTLPAIYQGILPELFFTENSEIVLEGYRDANGLFRSTTVIVKCPSKYEAQAEQQRAAAK